MSSDTSSPDVVFYFMSGSTCLSRLKQLPTDLQSRRMASGIKHLFWFIGSFMTIWAFVRQRVIFACILVQNQKIVFFFQCVKYAAEIYRFSFGLSYFGHFFFWCVFYLSLPFCFTKIWFKKKIMIKTLFYIYPIVMIQKYDISYQHNRDTVSKKLLFQMHM